MSEEYPPEKLHEDYMDEKTPFLGETRVWREALPLSLESTVSPTCWCSAKCLCANNGRRGNTWGWWRTMKVAVLCFTLLLIWCIPTSPSAEQVRDCAWEYIEPHTALLDVKPITRDEFLDRQKNLAAAINEAGADAFIAEPSASSTYYANVSSSFELSERPFLIILDKEGQFSYLVPKFEVGRIAGLDMVYESKKIIEWHEEESPYEALKRATGYEKVILDEHVRFMIAAGLEKGK